MKEKTGRDIWKFILVGIVIILAVLFIYRAFGRMLPDLLPVLRSGNEKEIESYLQNSSHWDGMLCVGLLQFIQVISIILPGTPIQIAAGVVYGVWKGFLLCYIGYVLANLLVFFVARRLGSQKVQNLLPMKMKSGWLEQKVQSANPQLVVVLACLVPAVPNGVIPYIAATTDMNFRQFGTAICAGSAFPILMSSVAGRLFLSGRYVLGVGTLLVNLAVILLILKNQDWILKRLSEMRSAADS